MDNQELVAAIKEGFQEGKRREEIHAELLQKGWKEKDIDLAIYHIQREALKVVPGFSHFFAWYDDPKTKEKLTTPKATVLIMAACFGILIVLALIFNYFFDPFNSRATQRDKQREADLVIMREGINQYYTQHHLYPSSLADLQPGLIAHMPTDPSSGKAYAYTPEDNGNNYQLCIEFEVETPQCIYATPIKMDTFIPKN